MFWYLAKLSVTDETITPGTTDLGASLRPVGEVYPDGRVVKVLADDLNDASCLCKWVGTPPLDWTQLSLEEAKTHFENRTGWEAVGVD